MLVNYSPYFATLQYIDCCSFCSAVSCWLLLLCCSCWIWSRRSRSIGVSVENLAGRGFGATCCSCVSFAWEIVRDSPMVNFVSKMMNKHIKMRLGHRRRSLCCLETQNAPWRHWRIPSIYSEKDLFIVCVASVSLRFRSKERGTRVKDRAKNGVSKRAGRILFLGLSLLRNKTETLAMQANLFMKPRISQLAKTTRG